MREKFKLRRGFTLIELLVVIAIIGLLSSIVLAATNTARANARNAARNEEAEQLITAFTEAYDDGQPLPVPAPSPNYWVCVSSSCYGMFSGVYPDPTVTAYLAPYLSTLPSDPSGEDDTLRGGGYIYAYYDPGTIDLEWNLESDGDVTCAAGATPTVTRFVNYPEQIPGCRYALSQ